ncbi:MAG: hypothetical protein AAGO57_02105 [Pseudomonadota bacterium]
MSDLKKETDALDAFFDAARAEPSADLMARVLADADAVQPVVAAPARRPEREGWFSIFGGWPALAGLATATVAGIGIGIADPTTVGDLAFFAVGDTYDFSTIGTDIELGLVDG